MNSWGKARDNRYTELPWMDRRSQYGQFFFSNIFIVYEIIKTDLVKIYMIKLTIFR